MSKKRREADVQGRLKDATSRVLAEHPAAEMAIVIMTGTRLEGNGFQVGQRIPVTAATHRALVNTLRMCADAIEAQGPAIPGENLS